MEKSINVLSLCDGISCGMLALNRAGIKVNNYYAFEIDKHAIKVSNNHFKDIIRLGDMNDWEKWDINYKEIDLILAGIPCQSWSVAGKQEGHDSINGDLFLTFIDILFHIQKLNPNVKFLLENVKMKNEFKEYFDVFLGVEGIELNSSLVSAQNRVRYYWTNIEGVKAPEDRMLTLTEVVAWSRSTRYPKDKPKYVEERIRVNGKSHTLLTGKGCGSFSSKNYMPVDETVTIEDFYKNRDEKFRLLTVNECEALQTLPLHYTSGVSQSQQYKMIGNAWTVNLIAHILQGLKNV